MELTRIWILPTKPPDPTDRILTTNRVEDPEIFCHLDPEVVFYLKRISINLKQKSYYNNSKIYSVIKSSYMVNNNNMGLQTFEFFFFKTVFTWSILTIPAAAKLSLYLEKYKIKTRVYFVNFNNFFTFPNAF